jgi:predicted nucleic acid-binding protein
LTALLDSNVLVASLVEDHPGHGDCFQLLSRGRDCATAAHVLSELYNTLTKPRFYGWSSRQAAAAVSEFDRHLTVVGLDPATHVAAIGSFAALGGVGATVFDYLIGASARRAGLGQIVTFNVKHFTPYFPDLLVQTPAEYLETL